jgi:hypothetical protein
MADFSNSGADAKTRRFALRCLFVSFFAQKQRRGGFIFSLLLLNLLDFQNSKREQHAADIARLFSFCSWLLFHRARLESNWQDNTGAHYENESLLYGPSHKYAGCQATWSGNALRGVTGKIW